MKRLIVFILTGVLFAAPGEYLFSVTIRGDLANFFGAMGFNSLYLLLVYLAARLLMHLVRHRLAALLIYYFATGLAGLMIEWYLIGNSPWGNPDASQVGMWAYWTSMSMMGLIFSDPDPAVHSLRMRIAAICLPAAAGALLLANLLPTADLRFVVSIWLVVAGYTLLTLFYLPYARGNKVTP